MAVSLAEISDVFAAAGINSSDHVKVEQVLAASPDELVDRVRARSLSNLAALPDAVFQQGLRAMERDAQVGSVPHRIVEELDLVVFRSGS